MRRKPKISDEDAQKIAEVMMQFFVGSIAVEGMKRGLTVTLTAEEKKDEH